MEEETERAFVSLKRISGRGFESLLLGRSFCLGLCLQRPVRVNVPTRVTLCCTCAFICVVLWQAVDQLLSLDTVLFLQSVDSRERERMAYDLYQRFLDGMCV